MPTFLSLDPGGTTGAALIKYEDNLEPIVVWKKQIKGSLKGFLDWHWDELIDTEIDFIVCEDFTLREGVHGVDLSPVYIIGALEALYAVTPIFYQAPKIKPLCDDLRLKKIGLHTPGKQHANDAVRHGIIYLRNSRHLPTLKMGWSDD